MAKDFTAYNLFFICCRKTNLVSMTRAKLKPLGEKIEHILSLAIYAFT